MSAITLSRAALWVENNVRLSPGRGEFRLTPEQARCVDVISAIDTGPHNVRPILGWGRVDFKQPKSVGILLDRDLATFDMSELTMLVLRSHQHRVRVEISPDAVPAALLVEEPERSFDRDELVAGRQPGVAAAGLELRGLVVHDAAADRLVLTATGRLVAEVLGGAS